MPRMAGIESTANTTSVSSIITSTRNSGVTSVRPILRTKKCSSWYFLVTGRMRRSKPSTGLFVRSVSSSVSRNIFRPVSTRKAPKM